jgi:hypothetical protein
VVPAGAGLGGGRAGGHGEDLGVPGGVEEEGRRDAVGGAAVADPVGRRAIGTSGHPFEHVTQVADERAGHGRGVDPTLRGVDLQTAHVVLVKDREQAVVGVLGHAPAVVGRGWVAEDPEQDRRVRGQIPSEPVGVEAEPPGDARHHHVPQRGHGVERGQHRGPQLGRPGREQVGAVQRHPRPHPRMVRPQLGAEVDAFLAVGHARGQLAAQREPAPPRPAGDGHGDRRLLGLGEGEERPGQGVEPPW